MKTKTLDDLEEQCDYATKLAVTAWVFRNLIDHAKEGGSYRYLIYERLGFESDAYVPLYDAGGLEISNEFDLERMETINQIVKDHKIEALKDVLFLCDEPDCFSKASVFANGRKCCRVHAEINGLLK